MLQLLGILLATTVVASGPAPMERPDPVQVLHEWDAARASAYAVADSDALRDLYVPGSTAGAADAAMLADYTGRGLTVWMRSQVFTVEVRAATDRRLTLWVTDRTVTVVGDGVRCRALPTSVPRRRQVLFNQAGGRWLVAAVSPVRRPAPR